MDSPTITILMSSYDSIRPNLMFEVLNLIEAGLCQQILNCTGAILPISRNKLVLDFKSSCIKTSHALFIDSDMAGITPDVVESLLGAGSDIVSPVMTKRNPPFESVHGPTPEFSVQDFLNVFTVPCEQRPIIDVSHVGLACTLVRKEVFETLPFPWFLTDRATRPGFEEEVRTFLDRAMDDLVLSSHTSDGIVPSQVKDKLREAIRIGKGHNEGMGPGGEDVFFCRQAKRHGFNVQLHTGVYISHIGSTRFNIGDHLNLIQRPDLMSRLEQLSFVWSAPDG